MHIIMHCTANEWERVVAVTLLEEWVSKDELVPMGGPT